MYMLIYDHHSCFRFVSSNKLVRANMNELNGSGIGDYPYYGYTMCDLNKNKIAANRLNAFQMNEK